MGECFADQERHRQREERAAGGGGIDPLDVCVDTWLALQLPAGSGPPSNGSSVSGSDAPGTSPGSATVAAGGLGGPARRPSRRISSEDDDLFATLDVDALAQAAASRAAASLSDLPRPPQGAAAAGEVVAPTSVGGDRAGEALAVAALALRLAVLGRQRLAPGKVRAGGALTPEEAAAEAAALQGIAPLCYGHRQVRQPKTPGRYCHR
jgi:hypothetical protein